MKKILIFMIVFIFGNIFFWNLNISNADCSAWQNCLTPPAVSDEPPKTPEPCKWESCLNSPNYMFPTSKFVPGGTFELGGKTQEKVENWLVKIIQNLMIPFWVLATIIMTIWAWYMVLHNWDDEMLNKWKKIFKMWIISIVIALSSYLLVELLKNLLYA